MYHKFTFEWTTGSAADNMIRLFREKGIHYERDQNFRLCACIGPGPVPVPVEYYHISGVLFGIAQKPQRTTEYFHLSPEALSADKGDGYTKEDCLLCDENPSADPFCDTLLSALEKADHYSSIGYEDIRILERLNNKYGVVAYG